MKTDVYLGVDYGVNYVRLGFASRSGQISNVKKIEVHNKTSKTIVSNLIRVIKKYLNDCSVSPTAIGIGLPGYINIDNGMWMHCQSMGVKVPLPIVKDLSDVFSVPIFIDNDLNAITLAENYFGIGRYCKDFIYMHAGDGVALGVVSGGRLIRGGANCAGEIGHMYVETGPAIFNNNSFGRLERILSMDEMRTQIDSLKALYPSSILNTHGKDLSHNDIFQAAKDGDELAMQITNRAIKSLGIGLVNSVNLLNPEQIVLGGYICDNAWFNNQVKKFVYANGFISIVATLKDISHSAMNEDYAQVIGAACLCYIEKQ